MSFLLGRRSLVRPNDNEPFIEKRSSSLPPTEECARTIANGTTATGNNNGNGNGNARVGGGDSIWSLRGVGRVSASSSANPIGLSRRSSELRNGKHGSSSSGSGRGSSGGSRQRSHSLTRIITLNAAFNNGGGTSSSGSGSGVNGGVNKGVTKEEGSNDDDKITRSSSFVSVASSSNGSDIFEPGWFSHAFHGSGACTCGKEHEGKSCADVWEENHAAAAAANAAANAADGDNADAARDNGEANAVDFRNDTVESEMKREDDGNACDAKSGSRCVRRESNATAETLPVTTTITTTTIDESSSSRDATTAMGSAATNGSSSAAPDESSYDAGTITSNNGNVVPSSASTTTTEENGGIYTADAAADGCENSTITSFSGRGRSIQSELLGGNGDDTKINASHRRNKPTRSSSTTSSIHAYQQQNDNDISSVTMDYLPNNNANHPPSNGNTRTAASKPLKSKSIVTKAKNNKTIGKVQKKTRVGGTHHGKGSNEFDKSDHNSPNSNSSTDTEASNEQRRQKRGRSRLGPKTRRNVGSSNATSAKTRSRRSRSGTHAAAGLPNPMDDDDDDDEKTAVVAIPQHRRLEARRDRRVRQRSLSIVRDARSLIDMIDKQDTTTAAAAAAATTTADGGGGGGGPRRSGTDGSGGDHDGAATGGEQSIASTIARSRDFSSRNRSEDRRRTRRTSERRRGSAASSVDDSDDASGGRTNPPDRSETTDPRNEQIIESLLKRITDLTNERNALRNNSERMMDITTKQKSELERELRSEREERENACLLQRREIDEWKNAAKRLERKCRDIEGELSRRTSRQEEEEGGEGMARPSVVRGVRDGAAASAGASDGNAFGHAAAASHGGPLEKEASLLASSLGINVSSLSIGDNTNASSDQVNLYYAILKLSEVEAKCNSQTEQLKSDNESLKSQANYWRENFDRLDKRHKDMLQELVDEQAVVNSLEEKLEGCRVVIESTTKKDKEERTNDDDAEASDNSAFATEDLVAKIGDLIDENAILLSKCREFERDDRRTSESASLESSMMRTLTRDLELIRGEKDEASAAVESLGAENRKLRATVAEQGRKANRRLETLVRSLRSSLAYPKEKDAESILVGEELDQGVDGNANNKNQSAKTIGDMEHEEALSHIQDIHAENDTLHDSMEETIKLAIGVNENMTNFVKKHESIVEDYETRLENLTDDWNGIRLHKDELLSELETLQRENRTLSEGLKEANGLVVSSLQEEIEKEKLLKESLSWKREKEELSTTNESLKSENEKLHSSFREMETLVATAEDCVAKLREENTSLKDAQERCEQQLQVINDERKANRYLRMEVKNVSTEREEAYDTCKVLQKEINQLRHSLKQSRIRVEKLNEDNASVSSASAVSKESQEKLKEKLAELTKTNESLTKETEQKNKALQAVQTALETLKVEQGTIKDTIIQLRTENAKLRSGAPPPPPPPRPALKSQSSLGSDSSQLAKLEKRIKNCEKENKGLREANSTLSAKLFDEMEKTDALRLANEGLAARICKLVAFIQQNPGSGGGEQGGGVGGSSVSSRSSSGTKNSKKTHLKKKR